jgi:hemerythrin-like domain-containing protein
VRNPNKKSTTYCSQLLKYLWSVFKMSTADFTYLDIIIDFLYNYTDICHSFKKMDIQILSWCITFSKIALQKVVQNSMFSDP